MDGWKFCVKKSLFLIVIIVVVVSVITTIITMSDTIMTMMAVKNRWG